MHTIWKYQLPDGGSGRVDMPSGARILAAQMQGGMACLWAEVDPNAPTCQRILRVVGTGHEFEPEGMDYIATFQQPPFVWHLFEFTP